MGHMVILIQDFFVCNRENVDSDTQRTSVLKLPLAVTVGRVIEGPTTEQKFRLGEVISSLISEAWPHITSIWLENMVVI